MRIRVVTLLMCGLLVACSDKQPVGQESVMSGSGAPDVAAVVADCSSSDFYSPLPENVAISFPFHLGSDRISPSKKGGMKRRVVMEIIDGDTAADFESAKQSLLTAGYKPSGKHKGDAGKKQSQKFKKKGAPTIRLTSNTTPGKKPANPGAKGVVYFDWQLAEMNKAVPVTSAK